MNESNNWNDLILKAHFQSLNPKWDDQESVITLLHEISTRLSDPKPMSTAERNSFISRIKIFVKSPGSQKQPLPMKQASAVKKEQKSRKTGS